MYAVLVAIASAASVVEATARAFQQGGCDNGCSALWKRKHLEQPLSQPPSDAQTVPGCEHSLANGQLYLQMKKQLLTPLPAEEVALPPNSSYALTDVDFAVKRHAPNGSWVRLLHHANARRVLKLTIVGTSSSAGCGARSPPIKCDGALSWGRRMHDSLRARLACLGSNGSVSVHTQVFAKNAVTLEFFAHCTASYVPSDTDILLIEGFMSTF